MSREGVSAGAATPTEGVSGESVRRRPLCPRCVRRHVPACRPAIATWTIYTTAANTRTVTVYG